MVLALLVGLAECIEDLTATGTTLRENQLVVLDEISTSTSPSGYLTAEPTACATAKSCALADAMQGRDEPLG